MTGEAIAATGGAGAERAGLLVVQHSRTGQTRRLALPVLAVVGDITTADLEAAVELGGGLAAGIEAGIF